MDNEIDEYNERYYFRDFVKGLENCPCFIGCKRISIPFNKHGSVGTTVTTNMRLFVYTDCEFYEEHKKGVENNS